MDPYILRDLEEIAPDLLDTLRERGLTLSTAESCTGGNIAHHLALGACKAFRTDCAVATSGIAGPGGGTDDKPVGTVWTAAVTPSGTVSEVYHLSGPRAEIIDKATLLALRLLINAL